MRIKLFHQFENQTYTSLPLPRKEEKLITFTRKSFEEYNFWKTNKNIQEKISTLIEDILRDPFRGLGKPEHLHRNKEGKKFGNISKGTWSRRINDEHRLVYEVDGSSIKILSCKGHYDD